MLINKNFILISVLLFSMFAGCGPKTEAPFLAELGVCTGFSNAEMLAGHGYTFVEETVGRFLVPDKSDQEFDSILQVARQAVLPVKACNSFIPGRLKSVGPEADHPAVLAYMETALKRAGQAGVEHIVFGSGGSRGIPEGFPRDEARRQFIELCKAMAPIAEKYNVIVVLEPLNTKEVNFVNSVAEGGEIVEEVNHPNFRLLADLYHMKMEDEGPENIIKYGHLIKHTHIAEKQERAAPGRFGEDFTPYFEALKKINYQGRMAVESRWTDLEAESAKAIETMKAQIQNL